MLLLRFEVGRDHYALDSGSIVEVIPWIGLRPVPHAPRCVVGLAHYRGRVVPILDLALLLEAPPCVVRLSTRIIVVRHQTTAGDELLLGLLAERVNDVWRVPRDAQVHATGLPDGLSLGPIYDHDGSLLQVIEIRRLLPRFEGQRFLAKVEEAHELA